MAISRAEAIEAALALVDSDGLDALKLRALAARLGVQAPTLYWHLRNKAELLEAMSDSIMDVAIGRLPPDPAGEWREWLVEAARALRAALLSRRDGARIVAGARASLRRADFSERAMAALLASGVLLQDARLTVVVVERFTVGFVLEEQSPASDAELDPAELARRLPTATRAIVDYFATGKTADDLFLDGVRRILH
jgi:TetR/AcrR family transcriptional regulator, tetracycline repressor protein